MSSHITASQNGYHTYCRDQYYRRVVAVISYKPQEDRRRPYSAEFIKPNGKRFHMGRYAQEWFAIQMVESEYERHYL